MTKLAIWITTSLLLIYFVFTSGLYYWLSDCQSTTAIITPYSWALSAEETGLTGVYTQGDIDCVEWLVNESNQDLVIGCDSNALYLLSGYVVLVPGTWELYGRRDRLAVMMEVPDLGHCYIFLREWNIEQGKYITPTGVGARRQSDFRIEDDKLFYDVYMASDPSKIYEDIIIIKEVYRSGESVVYESWPNL